MKAKTMKGVRRFQDIPNVGPAVEKDFKIMGFTDPVELVGTKGFQLYEKLCRITKTRHDPCVLDVFLAVADFANGKEATPWWKYTKSRKKKFPTI